MHEFNGKNVIITGGAGGMGLAIADVFFQAGARVHIFDKCNPEKFDQINKRKYIFHCVDVTDEKIIENSISSICEGKTSINVLVNCAGITIRKDALSLTLDEWNCVIDVNLTGTFLCSKYALKYMKTGSAIINISSGWGLSGGVKAVAYCASKGGVVQLTRAMALDCAPLGIRINCVCPGDTNTPMLIDEALQLSLPGDAFLKEGSNRPLGRVGNPEDIANAVWFLASPKSSFITGTTLIVDGGSLAGTQ